MAARNYGIFFSPVYCYKIPEVELFQKFDQHEFEPRAVVSNNKKGNVTPYFCER